jgi:hypothetical protein
MADALERAALEGRLTNVVRIDDEEPEPRRSRSNSPGTSSDSPPTPPAASASSQRSGAQTGPKGVLADWRATFLPRQEPEEEEEEEESDDAEAIEAWKAKRLAELQGSAERRQAAGTSKSFGHLREIGVHQFETAVLNESEDVKVVLHLYEPVSLACPHEYHLLLLLTFFFGPLSTLPPAPRSITISPR